MRDRRDSYSRLHQKRRKERKQIKDRHTEKLSRLGFPVRVALGGDTQTLNQEPKPDTGIRREIKRAGEAEDGGSKRRRHDEHGVDHDLTSRLGVPRYDTND